jgi:RNA polymerase sigma-70 factor (ECF subfamily)
VGTLEDPDAALVEEARRRNERAMEQLYRRHAPAIHAYALRSTRSEDTAEEVVQETFVRAFRSLSRFEGRSTFRTWLFSIAVRRTRTAMKKRPATEVLEDVPVADASPPSTPWLRRRLSRALGQLPQGYREVVVMHDVLGMGHDEIASARRCSVGTSKSQLHKARARLRSLLGGRDD